MKREDVLAAAIKVGEQAADAFIARDRAYRRLRAGVAAALAILEAGRVDEARRVLEAAIKEE